MLGTLKTHHPDLTVVKASDLIRSGLASDNLIVGDISRLASGIILRNQQFVADGLNRIKANNSGKIILDAHNVVFNGKEMVVIPSSIIRLLKPNKMIVITATPETILKQRALDVGRYRLIQTVDEVASEQDICLRMAREYCEIESLPLRIVATGDGKALDEAVSR